jgi:hypothetical protein
VGDSVAPAVGEGVSPADAASVTDTVVDGGVALGVTAGDGASGAGIVAVGAVGVAATGVSVAGKAVGVFVWVLVAVGLASAGDTVGVSVGATCVGEGTGRGVWDAVGSTTKVSVGER